MKWSSDLAAGKKEKNQWIFNATLETLGWPLVVSRSGKSLAALADWDIPRVSDSRYRGWRPDQDSNLHPAP